jgi:predicted small metal-binding protein
MSDEVTQPRGDLPRRYANSCACGWTVEGGRDDVVDATIDHGRRIHNMEATREQVLAALDSPSDGAAASGR